MTQHNDPSYPKQTKKQTNSKSATADMINRYIKEGQIVPATVTVGLLRCVRPHTPTYLPAWLYACVYVV